jgi:hypothetical protein
MMKTKGLSVFEKIVEKAVLAMALVAFLGVFAVQFLSSPTVELPGGLGTVPAQQATDLVAQEARNKVAQLESGREPEDLPNAPELASDIIARFDGPVTPVRQLMLVPEWPMLGGVDPGDIPVGPMGDGIFTVPTPIAPTNTTAALYMATIDPVIPLLHPDAAELLPEQQPLDKASVTVQVELDAEALLRQMAPADRPEGELILPQSWLNNMEVWDVELLRRSQSPSGTWNEPTIIPTIPGRPTLRDRFAEASPPDIASLVSAEQTSRIGLRQPRMYNSIAGDIWEPPFALRQRESVDRPAEAERLLRQVRSIRSEVESVQNQLDNLRGGRAMIVPGPVREFFDIESVDPNRITWPFFEDHARAQAGGGGGGGGGPRPPREDPLEERRRALEQRLERLNTQLQQAIDRLLELGYDADGRLVEERDEDDADSSNFATAPLAEAQVITLWAHDLTAEPGQTYQYAIRLKFRNPLFGNAASVAEGQQDLASRATISSELSPWSEPLQVPRMSEYFVVGANEGGLGIMGSSSPSVTIEAFRFFYGAWRQQTQRLNIGDTVIATVDLGNQEFPEFVLSLDSTGQVTLDEEKLLELPTIEVQRDDFLLDVVISGEDLMAYFFSSPTDLLALVAGDETRRGMLARMRESNREAANQEFRALDLTDSGSGSPEMPRQPNPGDPTDGGSPIGPASPMAPGGAAG